MSRGRLYLGVAGLEERAAPLVRAGVLSANDVLVVDAVAARFGETDPEVLVGLAFALRAPRVGDVGVHLRSIHERVDAEEPTPTQEVAWPTDMERWEAVVLASPMVGGPADTGRPFVRQDLADGRALLMTRRLWREQERLASAARELAAQTPGLALAGEELASGLARLFGTPDSEGARALEAAARGCLTVVTGGPGTGKTYGIKRLVALLGESAMRAGSALRIELAAPTGKAAVRMGQAIAEDLGELAVDEPVRELLAGLRPRTVHKLLGMRPDGSCRHELRRPLDADLVVVDEASMIDLGLMRRLFEAVPRGARLVLLGDRDQLASVEAGTVLADLVGPALDAPGRRGAALDAAIVAFQTNHRFARAPTIAAVARALQERSDEPLAQVMGWMSGAELARGETLPGRITHLGAPSAGRPTEAELEALAAPLLTEEGVIGRLGAALQAYGSSGSELRDPALHLALLGALDGYRVLAVHRRGPLGVGGLELALAKRCQEALRAALRSRLERAADVPVKLPARGEHWLGRPLLVTENSYELGLMNGDVGLVLATRQGLAAVFPGREGDREPTRAVPLGRLPDHAGALAMTVHKSQGSQFRRVALVLAGRDSPIQTRELVYTAITRASERLDWLGEPAELERALRRRVGRASGLADLLWEGATRDNR